MRAILATSDVDCLTQFRVRREEVTVDVRRPRKGRRNDQETETRLAYAKFFVYLVVQLALLIWRWMGGGPK
jgi:hypothetical protein